MYKSALIAKLSMVNLRPDSYNISSFLVDRLLSQWAILNNKSDKNKSIRKLNEIGYITCPDTSLNNLKLKVRNFNVPTFSPLPVCALL